MCGLAGIIGYRGGVEPEKIKSIQGHRGPDYFGVYENKEERILLCHNRLSIIDLSEQANQPFVDNSGRYIIIFNGEVYNYLELKQQLKDYPFRSHSDTEVVLAAFIKWGKDCLNRFIGMFAFVIWDKQTQSVFGARDRFGVKPLFYSVLKGQFLFASEIKTLFALGVPRHYEEKVWSTYLNSGMYDHSENTFWAGVKRLTPGHYFTYNANDGLYIHQWYDLKTILSGHDPDERDEELIVEELNELLTDSVKLRFRSDVPVGILLSGGLDSSLLYGFIQKIFGKSNDIKTFTFYSADEAYDERPWVMKLLDGRASNSFFCELKAEEVPSLVEKVSYFQDEPHGGFPILALSLLHQKAKDENVKVLLDGNGIDEGWAGYDYYERPDKVELSRGPIQSVMSGFSLDKCLTEEFRELDVRLEYPIVAENPLVNLQGRDLMFAKIPRAMRFADRVSMMHSRELREPFLDHRIIELGLRQPDRNKIRNGVRKFLVREIGRKLIETSVASATKRPVQTPQREWLRNQLSEWVNGHIEVVLDSNEKKWFDEKSLHDLWLGYKNGKTDNSFPIWQLVSLSMMLNSKVIR